MQTTCVSNKDNAKSNGSKHSFEIRENTSLDQLTKPTFRSRYAQTPFGQGPMDTVASSG